MTTNRLNQPGIVLRTSPKLGFSPICNPYKFFFKNRALSFLYPYGALTSCKKLEKTIERSLRYLKTDGHTDGRTHGPQGWLIRTTRVNPEPKYEQNTSINGYWYQISLKYIQNYIWSGAIRQGNTYCIIICCKISAFYIIKNVHQLWIYEPLDI